MNKKFIRTLFLSALGAEAIAILLFILNHISNSNDIDIVSIALALILFAIATQIISWILALVKTASLQRWGWFISLLVGGGISLVVYIFAGPENIPDILV